MKIYCEKCHEDISSECNRNIENYTVGRVVCPKCHYEQKRYISEADILLFFAVSETIYIIMSLITMFLFDKLGISVASIGIILAMVVASYFASKALSSAIYEKAYFKERVKYKEFEEDKKAIQRNISWQFLLFFAVTISFLTLDEGKVFFAIAMPVAAILSFIKFYFQVRYENNSK
ncbi:MAG: hypothetical protein IJI92_09035 [Erysipelotrichaceae bacterium]|nr:hypothetical protein [Erysipelotrichaceae bacterium]